MAAELQGLEVHGQARTAWICDESVTNDLKNRTPHCFSRVYIGLRLLQGRAGLALTELSLSPEAAIVSDACFKRVQK